ncbi:hypothetical protein ABFP04_08960 [Acinetobacter towneri]|uniref:hypothetical protein n=1 Tax=Acinetobacter towneri TaxID=202956 RepID=UPI003212C195
MLEKQGIIKIKLVKPKNFNKKKPILRVQLNNKLNLIYDTLDGFNWKDDLNEEQNLEFFSNNYDCDFYFKRSFKEDLLKYNNSVRKILPLGLNYNIYASGKLSNFQEKIKYALSYFIESKRTLVKSQYFEKPPLPNEHTSILFLTRLWDPKNVKNLQHKNEREIINENRVKCIEVCKKEFGDFFTGGLLYDSFSEKYAKNLCLPDQKTTKVSFLNSLQKHDICINTLGLHNSTGWKFAEYIAASRAIISEPLVYQSPNLVEGNNYLSFIDSDSLILGIEKLKKSKSQMMLNNYHYYNNFVRPDSLIMNSLFLALDNP